MKVVALVLGAGRGERLQAGRPKAAVHVEGRSLLEWSAAALGAARGVDAVLPVTPPEGGEIPGWRGPARLLEATEGGATRQESLGRGLAALAGCAPEAEWVLVHDAARCLVTADDAERVLEAARETGAAVPGVAVSDTIKRVRGDRVVETLDRGELVRVLTPQAFRVGLLREALDKAVRGGFSGTDCASLVERLGVEVRICPGRAENLKVTEPGDLERAAAVLRRRAARDEGGAS
jgi:2-C-methyl-D-erythritol 4-phosphate cytidylyltransferase